MEAKKGGKAIGGTGMLEPEGLKLSQQPQLRVGFKAPSALADLNQRNRFPTSPSTSSSQKGAQTAASNSPVINTHTHTPPHIQCEE